jgi:hypothetical protein
MQLIVELVLRLVAGVNQQFIVVHQMLHFASIILALVVAVATAFASKQRSPSVMMEAICPQSVHRANLRN